MNNNEGKWHVASTTAARAVATAIFVCLYMYTAHAQEAGAPSVRQRFAVLELFTAAGCAKCPLAEEFLPQLKDTYKEDLFILQFHVDYWDHKGWKDVFAQKEFTQRQRNYASVFNTTEVATPQAIINGRNMVNAGDWQGLKKIIELEVKEKKTSRNITLHTTQTDEQYLKVKYTSQLEPNEYLYIALVQKEAAIQVKEGENKGKLLKHRYIVRNLKTMLSEAGECQILIPKGLNRRDYYAIAYIQNTDNMKIVGVQEAKIE